MAGVRSQVAHNMRAGLVLLLAVPLAGCPEDATSTTPKYALAWTFVNTSSMQVRFTGSDLGSGASGSPSEKFVSIHTTSYGVNTRGDFLSNLTRVKVEVHEVLDPSSGATAELDVALVSDKTTAITATWNGCQLSISAVLTGAAAAILPDAAAAGSCALTWQLVGITGSTSGSWSDQYGSATGTLTLNVPQTLTEGTTVAVSATFAASVTEAAGWARQVGLSVGLVDRGVPGFVTNNTASLGTANLSVSGSVTVNANWVIPTGATTLKLEAGGNILQGGPAGNGLNVMATYAKVP